MTLADIRESTAVHSTERSTGCGTPSTEASASVRVDINVHDFDSSDLLEDFQRSRPSAVPRVPSVARSCKSMLRRLRYIAAPGKKTRQHDAVAEHAAVYEAEAPEDAPVLLAGRIHRSLTK